MNILKIFILAILLLLICSDISAQLTIDGTITDSELSPISNALVEIIDEIDTTNSYSSYTNDQGYFNISVITNVKDELSKIPEDFIVLSNYPNPFNPSTIIYYELPKAENVEITIYDILGREIRTLFNNFHNAGAYSLEWNGKNNWNSPVAAGIYFCRLKTKNNFKVHKMVLLDGGTMSATNGNPKKETSHFQNKLAVIERLNFKIRVSGNNILESDFNYLTCTKDTTINLIVPRILNTVTIGSEGGQIILDGLVLEIPPFSFSSNENLIIATPSDDDPFVNEKVTAEFIIDGFPINYANQIKVHLEHNGNLENESFILLGEDGLSPDDGNTEFVYDFIPAIDSSGYLVGNLNSESTNSILKYIKPTNDKKRILVKGISKYYTYATATNVMDTSYEYKIYLPIEHISFVPKIVELFDEAFLKCYINLKILPMTPSPSIYLANLNKEIFCKYAYRNAVGNKKSKGLFAVNLKHLNNLGASEIEDKLKRSIGKEFLRFLLFYYDPTFPVMINPAEERHYWLKQAMVTWFGQEYILGDYDYVPEEFKGNELSPLNGMHAGISIGSSDKYLNARNHGSGMSSLFKFFTISPSWKISPFIYQFIFSEIKKGTHPVQAFNKLYLESSSPDGQPMLSLMWFDYMSAYIQQRPVDEIFYVFPNTFYESISKQDTFLINSSSDSLKEFKRSYKDLSAKLFKIVIKDQFIKENGSLIFDIHNSTTDLKYINVEIYGEEGSFLHSLGEISYIDGNSNVQVSGFMKYDPIVALVINGKYSPPYTNNSEIQLDVRLNNSPFKYCDIRLSVIGIEDTTKGQWSPGWYTKGYFINNIYYGTINTEKQGGNAEGTIEIKVDSDFNIIALQVVANHSDEFSSSAWGFSAVNIPPTENEPYLKVYSYSGYKVCNYVTDIYARYDNPDGSLIEIKRFECEAESNLHIKFHNWD